MKTTMEKRIYKTVQSVCMYENDRHEAAMTSARILNDKYGINCARDDTKAGDYLAEALDHFGVWSFVQSNFV